MTNRYHHTMRGLPLALLALLSLLAGLSPGTRAAAPSAEAPARAVHARFDLAAPQAGPFPSDRFTITDRTQLTGRRVSLPPPDPAERPSGWEDIQVINTLDGFNLQPRLSIPFDGPIDVASVNSRSVFLVRLGSTLPGGQSGGKLIGINQIVWDPATNTLHVESDELLEQHTRYGLIVTRRVRDRWGRPVWPSASFLRFLLLGPGGLRDYRDAVVAAIWAARGAGVRETEVVSASVFTTQSVTAVLEKIRDQIKTATPTPADFRLNPGGSRTVFALDEVTGITWRQQTGTAPTFNPVPLNLALLQLTPGAIGRIAFGKYLSPDYLTPGRFIPAVGTRSGQPVPQQREEVFFNLVLPSGPVPAGGWPVAIFGHGSGGHKQGSFALASTLASYGIATLAINVVAHGFGPLGTLTVSQATGEEVTFPAGGRAIDINGNGVIEGREGDRAPRPWEIIEFRDTLRQTVADLMQLVRVIEAGIDVDGDQSPDLNPAHLLLGQPPWVGSSAPIFLAIEPSVRAGVLNVGPAAIWEQSGQGGFSPPTGRESARRACRR